MVTPRRAAVVAVSAAVLTVLAVLVDKQFGQSATAPPVDRVLSAPATDASYAAKIQPLLERRCVVCHACFDAPCQLNLQSFDGVDRGASQTVVYQPERAFAIPPTRMFQDAQTTSEWRTRFDFFPVLERGHGPEANLDRSLLYRVVQQRRENAMGAAYDASTQHVCPRSLAEFEAMRRTQPQNGMPFGFPPLSDEETARLADWVRAGAGGPPAALATSANSHAEIAKWENFLDADDPKTRIFARYLFEHLFFAHLGFAAAPGEWFRLVRSRTRAPKPVDEIATVRPYDDPKLGRVHYRFRRLSETIVLKTHIPLSPRRREARSPSCAFPRLRLGRREAPITLVRARDRVQSVRRVSSHPRALALSVLARRRALPRQDIHPWPGLQGLGRARRDRRAISDLLPRARFRPRPDKTFILGQSG